MYQVIRIHTPAVAHQNNAVVIHTLSTIPEFLREAITLVNHELWLDNEKGYQTAPTGSVIGYEKSDMTSSGYNCWFMGHAAELMNIDGIFYTRPVTIHSIIIPDKDEARPVWAHSCDFIYNGDGTVTLKNNQGNCISGRIGIDFLLCQGMKNNGKVSATILTRDDESYNDYIVCDENGTNIGKLSELYPA